MFLSSLRRLRPETSLFLAVAAIAVGSACEPAVENNDNTFPVLGPDGGGGGTPGAADTGAPPIGTTDSGATPGGTPGAMPGGTTEAGSPGGTGDAGSPGGTVDAGPGGGAPGGGDAGSPGGTKDSGIWTPPAQSVVKGTGGACLSVQAAKDGKCGSYFCGVTKAQLAPEINPSAVCGGDVDFTCEGSMPKVVTDCAVMHALAADDVMATTMCVKMNASVMSHDVKPACIDCFVAAAKCCKNNFECFAECLVNPGTKACDDLQKKAGCLTTNFACTGLPNPL